MAQGAEDGITDQELAETKTYLTGSYPLRFDGNGPIAAILAAMQMRSSDRRLCPVTRNARIEAVTLEDVKRVAARLLHPDALHFIVVGQPEGRLHPLACDRATARGPSPTQSHLLDVAG
jgi:zinc protease